MRRKLNGRILAFILSAAMIFGDCGSMKAMAAEPDQGSQSTVQTDTQSETGEKSDKENSDENGKTDADSASDFEDASEDQVSPEDDQIADDESASDPADPDDDAATDEVSSVESDLTEDIDDLGVVSGKCGENAAYTLIGNTKDGVEVLISGSGAMYDYDSKVDSPWSSFAKVTGVTIEDGITHIGNNSFYFCTNITSVSISDSVTSIGDNAFNYCGKLTSISIPDGVTSIGSNAFYSTGITSLTVPGSVADWGASAFASCTSLKSLTIGSGAKTIGEQAFYRCTGLTSVSIPDSVTDIGRYAFNSCSSLTSLTIPSGIETVGDSAFGGCSALTSVTLKNKRISNCMFEGDTVLGSITIPEGVEEIGYAAFRNCSGLKSVTLPSTLKEIGAYAFSGCTAITDFTDRSSGSWYSDNDGSEFDLAAYMKNTAKSGNPMLVKESDVRESGKCGDDLTYTLEGDNSDGYTLKISGKGAMYDFKESGGRPWGTATNYACNIKSLEIGSGVTHIGSYAFSTCNFSGTVTIPGTVTSIGERAFSGAVMPSITIPDSVASIGEYAFNRAKIGKYNSSSDKYTGGTLSIPGSVTTINEGTFYGMECDKVTLGSGIEKIGSMAFQDCTMEGELTIPASVTSIDSQAFYSNDKISITSVTFGENSDLTEIGSSAFSGCTSLTTVTLPDSLTEIGSSAFYGCTSLTTVTLPDSLTEIGSSAFKGCTSLASVTLPSGLAEIRSSAFYNCSALASVTLPSDLAKIGSYAFYGCTALKTVTLPDSLTEIGEYAFNNCSALTSVTLPDSLTEIGAWAFYGCTALKTLTLPASVSMIGLYAFPAQMDVTDEGNGGWYTVDYTSVSLKGGTTIYPTENIYRNVEGSDLKVYSGSAPVVPTYYTVKFDLNGGEGTAPDTQTVLKGEKVTEPDVPTKTGCKFTGWKFGSKSWNFATGTVSSDMTLTAGWEELKFTVTFNLNGGMGKTPAAQTVIYGKQAKAPTAPTRTGYTFEGWTDGDGNLWDFETGAVTSDLELTASWEAEQCSVVFDSGYNGSFENCTVSYGNLAPLLPDPTRTGYTFKGWMYNGKAWDFDTPVTCDMIITATWAAEDATLKHTVIFDAAGGTMPEDTAAEIKVNDTDTVNASDVPVPTKDGYELEGWTFNGAKWDFSTPVTKDMTLTAVWAAEDIPEGTYVYITDIPVQTYTGSAIKPVPVVVNAEGEILKAGTDYKISKYTDNTKASEDGKTAAVTVTGTGNYAGSATAEFKIEPASMKDVTVTTAEYTVMNAGQTYTPSVTVKYGKNTLKKTTAKTAGDYTLTVTKVKDADGNAVTDGTISDGIIREGGTYTLTLTGQGNYKDSTEKTVTVSTGKTLFSKTKMTLPAKSYIYNGGEQKPSSGDIKIMNGKNQVPAEDYEISCTGDTTAVGTVTVTATAKETSSYIGTVSAAYTITGKPISKATVKLAAASGIYDGSTVSDLIGSVTYKVASDEEGAALAALGGLNSGYRKNSIYTLAEGRDYEVTYAGGAAAGKKTITIKGQGFFTGTVTKTYTVGQVSLKNHTDWVSISDAVQNRAGAVPEITVTAELADGDSEILTEGTDYTVTYKNNTNITTDTKKATATIKGKGNYKDSITVNYSITPKVLDLGEDDLTIVYDNPVYSASKKDTYEYVPTVKLYDNGKLLTQKKDYNIEYSPVTQADYKDGKRNGSFRITAGTNGCYTTAEEEVDGECDYTVASRKLTKNMFGKIADCTYTGSAITLDGDDITAVYGKGETAETLAYETDFVITGYSKNVNKGTAAVTVRGIGDYSGTVTLSFKIVARRAAD